MTATTTNKQKEGQAPLFFNQAITQIYFFILDGLDLQYAARFFLPFVEAATHVQSFRFRHAVADFIVLHAATRVPFFGAADTLPVARPAASKPTAAAIAVFRKRLLICLISFSVKNELGTSPLFAA